MPDERTDLICPDCKALMVLREGKFGLFYGCSTYPECTCAHGAHKEGGAPLGIPANRETKDWRIKAHDAFDGLWKVKKAMTRKEAYLWMSEVMELSHKDAHIGMFDIVQCEKLIGLVFDFIKKLLDEDPGIELEV